MTADSITQVGVAIVQFHESFLVGIRGDSQTLAGHHEFPGGKCHPVETPIECAVRECLEETGINSEPVKVLETRTHQYEHGTVAVSFVLCRLAEQYAREWDGIEFPKSTGNFSWVHKSQLGDCNFPAANAQIVRMISEDSFNLEP